MLDLPLHLLPQLLAPERRPLVPQHVVAELWDGEVVFAVSIRVVSVQRSLIAQLLEGESGEVLRALVLVPAGSDVVAPARARRGDEEEGYKLPKILSKRLAKVSSDLAGEGEFGVAVGAEGVVAGSEVRRSLLVAHSCKHRCRS